MRLFLRFIGWIFAGGTIMFLVGVTAVAGLLWHFSQGPAGLFTACRTTSPR